MRELKARKQGVVPAQDLRVVVTDRGPYLVYGQVPFTQQFIMPDAIGESWFYKQGDEYQLSVDLETPTALCRCGASHTKPFCDGSHTTAEWDSELTADRDRLLDGARYFEGDELLLSDNERYCSYARFCHPGGGAWRLTEESADPESRELAIREASMCPSARLMAWGRGEDNPYEFDFEPSIALLEDPEMECSAGLWLRGGVSVVKESGEEYEVRNRVVLCRCGASHNKPYCDGSHASAKWDDSLLDRMMEGDGEEIPDGDLVVV